MKKYVFNYFGRTALCQSPEEAVSFINDLSYRGNGHKLECNDYCRRKIEDMFAFDKEIASLSTTGCGNTRIYIYPALAATLEEHNRLYEEKLAHEKAERMRENAERIRIIEKELNEHRPGIYTVCLSCSVTDNELFLTRLRSFEFTVRSDSAMQAYTQTIESVDEKLRDDPYVASYTLPVAISKYYEYQYIGNYQ